MAGFLRKVAGAFVYLDDEPKPDAERTPDLDAMSLETTELLTQLSSRAEPAPSARFPDPGAASPAAETSVLDMTADQVFASAGVPDGPNSAQRVLKIIAGLAMFPTEQQVVMVRAMDAADEAWSEADVMQDARRRQSTLRTHVQAIEAERSARAQALALRIDGAQTEGRRQLEEYDRQIAELHKQRESAIAATTAAVAQLEHERKSIEESAEKARRGITAVINALSELITFFTGGDVRSQPKP